MRPVTLHIINGVAFSALIMNLTIGSQLKFFAKACMVFHCVRISSTSKDVSIQVLIEQDLFILMYKYKVSYTCGHTCSNARECFLHGTLYLVLTFTKWSLYWSRRHLEIIISRISLRLCSGSITISVIPIHLVTYSTSSYTTILDWELEGDVVTTMAMHRAIAKENVHLDVVK